MQAFFEFLGANPYILLFFTVGMAVWVGKAPSRATGSAWWPRPWSSVRRLQPGHRPTA